jgi:hypothetical protein
MVVLRGESNWVRGVSDLSTLAGQSQLARRSLYTHPIYQVRGGDEVVAIVRLFHRDLPVGRKFEPCLQSHYRLVVTAPISFKT